MATTAAAAMIQPPDSLLRYNPPVLVSRRTEKRSPGVSGAGRAGPPAGRRRPHLPPSALSAGPAAEGDPAAAARPERARRAAAPDARRRLGQAAAGDPEHHPAAAGVGGGEPALGAGGVQRAQHPPGRGAPAGAAGPAAAAAAGAGDRHLPRAQGALLAVLRLLCPFCKDELIRETTINCAERGLLLLRVRDEIQMTIAAYQMLYESSVAFGMRKALQAEQGKSDMEKRIAELEEEKRELEKQVSEEKARCEAIEKRETERRRIEEKKHTEEVQFLKQTNQQLKAQLESIIAPNK
ncbi:axonemal dynein light intermediate polypeptide 1 isoform X1 [Rissa tridactyla]|uniref:axonemal dynein light intermediate polypeptide 1 isoform X1 n=1 Tax=Rissa tridactyla TaxID=75485 RepID=UPI0023BA42C5|nr:axonemal dynein light intermediate polypeptide 1 isoform X1 [Rissa tridactyla]